MGKEYIPQRSDLIWIDMNPLAGHVQSGRRPAIVLSPKNYNDKVGLALLCPITNQVKGYPFEVILPEGLKIKGVILSDQLKSLDWKIKKAAFIDSVPEHTIEETLKKAKILLQS